MWTEGADSEEISSLSLSRKPGTLSILISTDHRWWQEVEKGYHRLWPQATSLLSSVQAHVKTANVVPHLTKQSAWHSIRVGGSCEVANIPSWLWVFSKEKFVHNLRVKALKVSRDVWYKEIYFVKQQWQPNPVNQPMDGTEPIPYSKCFHFYTLFGRSSQILSFYLCHSYCSFWISPDSIVVVQSHSK